MIENKFKKCPRCGRLFECKPEDITECQCFHINLSKEELQILKEVYKDCICAECLVELKEKYRIFKKKVKLEFIKKYIRQLSEYRN